MPLNLQMFGMNSDDYKPVERRKQSQSMVNKPVDNTFIEKNKQRLVDMKDKEKRLAEL